MMQDKPKFTPGPWELEETEDGHIIRMGKAIENHSEFPSHLEIDYDHGCLLDGDEGDVFNEVEIRQAEEAYANANLIAAAPDMYKACTKALNVLRQNNIYGETELVLRLAIAKAQGSEFL